MVSMNKLLVFINNYMKGTQMIFNGIKTNGKQI